MAQSTNEYKKVTKKKLDTFANRIALEMGLRIIDLAKSRNQHIAVEISRLNQTAI